METTEPIQTKFCTVTETTKMHFVGGPSRRATNPTWRTAAILKNRKRPYLRNALTDLHKIWHDGAFWPSEGYGQLKFPTFENPRWRTAAILKNRKPPYLCNGLTDLHRCSHNDEFWPSKGYLQFKFPTFANPRWWTAAILKNSIKGHISGTA